MWPWPRGESPSRFALLTIDSRHLSLLYVRAHDRMRDVDGFLPQEALDELLKFLFYKECTENAQGPGPLAVDGSSDHNPTNIRRIFAEALELRAPWAFRLWQDGRMHASDRTLSDLQGLFHGVCLTDLPLDVRSNALRTFLDSDVRKGLGIFLTPEDVARMMVEVIAPAPSDVILDPACGSATFLLEAARYLSRCGNGNHMTLYGAEKNPRMLLLADLNIGHRSDLSFKRACADSLRELDHVENPLGIAPGSVDVILTNPPFGVTVTRDTGVLDLFGYGDSRIDSDARGVPSEVLFVRLCLRLLRPGGRLGIILPRSVITNEGLAADREAIDRLGCLTHLVDLPTETFAAAGTQTKTVAAFFGKYQCEVEPRTVAIQTCRVTNVGVDGTGRRRVGNQLPHVAECLRGHGTEGGPSVVVRDDVAVGNTLQQAATCLFRRSKSGLPLRRFVALAGVGRTPSRTDYSDRGTFIVKVGNLTGHGIDWEPRDRNFVSRQEADRRSRQKRLDLRVDDILLTSSAHATKYIAKKVDIVVRVPEAHEAAGVTFVGELIRIRAGEDVDPYILLAVLRRSDIREDIQASVRGQTAHLNPDDLLDVAIPWDLRRPSAELMDVAALLRREALLAFELSTVSMEASARLKSTNAPPV